jgi:3-oxoacyl-[acyl-carrier-protein] synthase II
MEIYIQGLSSISPFKPLLPAGIEQPTITFSSNRLACIEPDYSTFFDIRQMRRMSRILRMGVSASIHAMKDAGQEQTDAVIVGTGLGCLEDTYSFLKKMVQNKEDMLSPTPFIYSTHNTIAAQIALQFQCTGYNSTYVHRNISFESALKDAILLLKEEAANCVLLGGIDELTDTSFTILNRLGHYKKEEECLDGKLYGQGTRGSIAGEGASFFTLTGKVNAGSYAKILAVKTVSFSTEDEAVSAARQMMLQHGIVSPDIFLAGNNGDAHDDAVFDAIASKLALGDSRIKFKHLCGEYPTASAFALWMASVILKQGGVPEFFQLDNALATKKIETILIHNQFKSNHHSLILLSKC